MKNIYKVSTGYYRNEESTPANIEAHVVASSFTEAVDLFIEDMAKSRPRMEYLDVKSVILVGKAIGA